MRHLLMALALVLTVGTAHAGWSFADCQSLPAWGLYVAQSFLGTVQVQAGTTAAPMPDPTVAAVAPDETHTRRTFMVQANNASRVGIHASAALSAQEAGVMVANRMYSAGVNELNPLNGVLGVFTGLPSAFLGSAGFPNELPGCIRLD